MQSAYTLKELHTKGVIRLENSLTKRNKRIEKIILLSFIIPIMIFLRIHYLASTLPDNKPDVIRDHLSRAGYDVESIVFEETSDKSVYRASAPIMLDDGGIVEYWKVETLRISLPLSRSPFAYYRHSVSPYYEMPPANVQ